MYKDKFFRTWAGKFHFDEKSVKQNAPTSAGVYQILYLEKVVYIGISGSSIRERLLKHVTGLGNWGAARRTDIVGYEFVFFLCDGVTAKQIESHVITSDKPPFNVKPEYKHYLENISVH